MTPSEFREAKERLGWSVQRLADEMNVTKRTVYKWLAGYQPIPGLAVVLMRKFLEEAA